MNINALTKEDVFRTLVASAEGLSTEEVRRRLTEFGRNEITAVKGKNLVLRLLSQFTHFLAIVLWLAAFFRSFPSTSIPARACSPSASPS